MMMCDTMIYHAMHYDGGDDDDGVAGSRMVRVMTMMMRLCVFIVMVIIAATITIFSSQFSSFGKFLQQPVCCMKKPRLLQPRDRIAASAVAASAVLDAWYCWGAAALGRIRCPLQQPRMHPSAYHAPHPPLLQRG